MMSAPFVTSKLEWHSSGFCCNHQWPPHPKPHPFARLRSTLSPTWVNSNFTEGTEGFKVRPFHLALWAQFIHVHPIRHSPIQVDLNIPTSPCLCLPYFHAACSSSVHVDSIINQEFMTSNPHGINSARSAPSLPSNPLGSDDDLMYGPSTIQMFLGRQSLHSEFWQHHASHFWGKLGWKSQVFFGEAIELPKWHRGLDSLAIACCLQTEDFDFSSSFHDKCQRSSDQLRLASPRAP